MRIKDKITEAAERVYDITRDGRYNVKVNLLSKKNNAQKPFDIKVVSSRNTKHNKKWRAKNY